MWRPIGDISNDFVQINQNNSSDIDFLCADVRVVYCCIALSKFGLVRTLNTFIKYPNI